MKTILKLFLLLFSLPGYQLSAQKYGTIVMDEVVRNHYRTEITIPDIPGYLTLKCDFHMHTVFSDGNVWPTVRVSEAWEDGLDAIAITDHIEGNPKKMPGLKHTEFEVAQQAAESADIILIRGGEISRSMPPGHFNALFITDVDALNLPDYLEAIGEAVKQGGFIIWNHPGWRRQQPDSTKWMKEHEDIYRKGWMHGIEIFNEKEWYPEAIQWAMEKNLTIFGNSDIHEGYDYKYNRELYPVRPVTLVFAKERSEASIKEAMFEHRTATLFFNKLVGKDDLVSPLVEQSVQVAKPHLYKDGYIYFNMKNLSDIEFTFVKTVSDNSELPSRFILPPGGTIVLKVKQVAGKANTYYYTIENVFTGVEKHLVYKITIL